MCVIVFELNPVEIGHYGKNELGENRILSSTICLQTSEEHSFRVQMEKWPKICRRVKQIFLYRTGL